MSSFKLALVQLAVTGSKGDNISRALKLVKEAADAGAKLITLPECFNSPYGIGYFSEYAEEVPDGSTCKELSKCAKDNGVYLVGGSIPEQGNDGKLFNTCTVWGPSGNLLGLHRKVHLFDIDIPGKITFQESKVLTRGNQLTTFATDLCKVGVGICYDIRFPEMAHIYRHRNCDLLIYPGAFNMTTGPAHWQILQQARALDNQVYVATCSPARDTNANYVAWGHSMAVGPWGNVLAEADADECIIYADIDLEKLKEVRSQIPLGSQKRNDLYKVVDA